MSELSQSLIFIIDNYSKYYSLIKESKEYVELNSAFKKIKEEIIIEVKKKCLISDRYDVKFNKGSGKKPAISLLSIRNTEVSKTMRSGIYVVLLFRRNDGVYISLNQGTEGRKINEIERKTELYRNLVFNKYTNIIYKYKFVDDVKISDNLQGVKKLTRPKEYEAGNIVAKYYSKKDLIEKCQEFIEDIKIFLEIYNNIIKDDRSEVAVGIENDNEDDNKNEPIKNLINIDNLLGKKMIITKTEREKQRKDKRKLDRKIKNYSKKERLNEEDKMNVGWFGELYIYERIIDFNLELIKELGIENEDIINIQWFNKDINIHDGKWNDMSVGHGCDIIIKTIKRRIYLEIKSSLDEGNVLTITGNEIRTAYDNNENYFIIKVNNILKNIIKVIVISDPYKYFLDNRFREKLKDISFYL